MTNAGNALTIEQKAHLAWARGEIIELPARYCWGVAHGDVDYLVNLFTAEGSFDARVFNIGFPKGHDELRAYFAKYTPPRMRFPMVHNNVITALGDDEATATCAAEVLSLKDGQFIASPGMYEDHFRLVDGRWKFSSRRILHFEFVPLDEGLVKLK
jgi:hypothetical protein